MASEIPTTLAPETGKRYFVGHEADFFPILIHEVQDRVQSGTGSVEGLRKEFVELHKNLLSFEPEPENPEPYDQALKSVGELLAEIEGMSRKRSRSVTSPSTKPAKHRKVSAAPLVGGDTTAPPPLGEDMLVDTSADDVEMDEVAQLIGTHVSEAESKSRDAWSTRAIQDMVTLYSREHPRVRGHISTGLSTAYVVMLEENVRLTAKAYRNNK